VTVRHKKIEREREDCRGTGLYSGMCEGEGVAVVCLGCGGTGRQIVEYVPFVKRRGRKDIKTVRQSRGTFIATGVGPVGRSITYAEFARGKRP
jgi:hypothetical protein